MEEYICITCGTQYPAASAPPAELPDLHRPAPVRPARRPAVDDARASSRAEHENAIRDEGDLVGIGTEPHFAIGQRALLVPFGDSNLLWDCVSLLDDATAAEVERRGGLAGDRDLASALLLEHGRVGAALRLPDPPARRRRRVGHAARPGDRHWDGEQLDLGHGLTLIRGGGHFPGGTILHRADGAGSLLVGDIIQVIPDRTHVGFMWSYPNLVPLPDAEVQRMAAAVEPFAFEAIYGAWWEAVIPAEGPAIVRRSADTAPRERCEASSRAPRRSGGARCPASRRRARPPRAGRRSASPARARVIAV